MTRGDALWGYPPDVSTAYLPPDCVRENFPLDLTDKIRETFIECDECHAVWGVDSYAEDEKIRDAVIQEGLQTDGWLQAENLVGNDLCPDCVQRHRQVRVYLNQNTECFMYGHRPGDQLVLAVSWDEPDFIPTLRGPERLQWKFEPEFRLLGKVFGELNRDNPAFAWGRKYRDDGNRSLSVGDLVIIGDRPFACEGFGWRLLDRYVDPAQRR